MATNAQYEAMRLYIVCLTRENEELRGKLAEAEARCAAMRTTLYGAHELLRVVVDDLAEFAEGGCDGSS